MFEYVGDRIGLTLEVVITDGTQPIGRGIGPVLEARDVMQVLHNDPQAPMDLREKALQLAGRILEFDPDVRGGQGYFIARDILDSGRALAKMEAIIDAQGRNPRTTSSKSPLPLPTLTSLIQGLRSEVSWLEAGYSLIGLQKAANGSSPGTIPGPGRSPSAPMTTWAGRAAQEDSERLRRMGRKMAAAGDGLPRLTDQATQQADDGVSSMALSDLTAVLVT